MQTNEVEKYSGSCACGSVTYQVDGDLGDVTYCHCVQCQKASGHYVASTSAKTSEFILTNDELDLVSILATRERGFFRSVFQFILEIKR